MGADCSVTLMNSVLRALGASGIETEAIETSLMTFWRGSMNTWPDYARSRPLMKRDVPCTPSIGCALGSFDAESMGLGPTLPKRGGVWWKLLEMSCLEFSYESCA